MQAVTTSRMGGFTTVILFRCSGEEWVHAAVFAGRLEVETIHPMRGSRPWIGGARRGLARNSAPYIRGEVPD